MDSVSVAKRMGTGVFLQTSVLAGPSYGIADRFPPERLVGILSGEHPFPRPHPPPIAAQQLQELGGQLDIAALVALAQLDANHHPLAVNVGGAQMHHFTDLYSGTVHGAEDDMVSKGRCRLQ